MSQVLRTAEARYPPPDLAWIEGRFWVWIRYATLKVGRGELFEAVDFLAFLRVRVLGPSYWWRRGRSRQVCAT
ncbi:hypothetical protein [Xanthomonas massiliensis]|uniref:hypothetical protein n=1 Tax=Xanthomonas massiliensis TaxID=1720302 RepID=UPI0011CB0C02|nr:hypothetical protein [Xanthomonas massiliensis]